MGQKGMAAYQRFEKERQQVQETKAAVNEALNERDKRGVLSADDVSDAWYFKQVRKGWAPMDIAMEAVDLVLSTEWERRNVDGHLDEA